MVIRLLFSFFILIASTGYGGVVMNSPCPPYWQPITECLKCEADCPVDEVEYDCGSSVMTKSIPSPAFLPQFNISPLWGLGLLGLLDFDNNSRGNGPPFIPPPFNPNFPNNPGPPFNPPNNPNNPDNPDPQIVPEPASYIVMSFIALCCLFIVKKNKDKNVQVFNK